MADIRVGGAFVTLSAETGRYTAGLGRATAANASLRSSYAGLAQPLAGQSVLVQRFGASLQSSIIATVAYAAGVNALRLAVSGSFGAFVDYDAALIRVAKTSDITGPALARLGERLQDINTLPEGGRRALPILRRDLLEIAEAVGQFGVRGVENITRVTRAAAALQVSSNLSGRDAAQSLVRYIRVTGQGIERTDALASAFTALGNNTAATEAEIAHFAQTIAQQVRATGGLTDELILGTAASFAEVGARAESASTVIGRTTDLINRLASSDAGVRQLRLLGDAAGFSQDAIAELTQELQSGQAGPEAYSRGLLLIIRALNRLPAAAEPGQLTRGGLLELIFGESNVRIRGNLNLLAQGLQRTEQNVRTANDALISADEHFREAARAAEGFGARFSVVGRAIERQGTTVGSFLVPALIELAEAYRAIEVAGVSAAVAFGVGRIRARTAARREETAATLAQLAAERDASTVAVGRARVGRVRATEALTLARENSRLAGLGVTGSSTVAQATAAETRQLRRKEAALSRLTREQVRATTAQNALNLATRQGSRLARAGAASLAFLGGPVGIITGLLTVGVLAWAAWGGAAEDASRTVLERLEGVADSIEDANLGLADRLRRDLDDAQGLLVDYLEVRVNIARDLRRQFGTGISESGIQRLLDRGGGLGDQFGARANRENVARIERVIAVLQRRLTEAGKAGEAAGAQISISIDRSTSSLLAGQRAALGFRDRLRDALRTAGEEAALRERTAGLAPLASDRETADFSTASGDSR